MSTRSLGTRAISTPAPGGASRTRDAAVRVARLAGALFMALAASEPAPAEACGGAFFSQSAPDVVGVRGHQMAIAISKKQTVVWDRIDVEGNPSELAWVIPVRDGAKLELASEKWFTALGTQTAPKVQERGTYSGRGGAGEGGGGCACGSAMSDTAAGASDGRGGKANVTVLERNNVGPYDAARLRATDPGAARTWLVDNGFRIPDDIGPVLDEYTREGFDFIALRVRPGGAATGLTPLRLTTPGADPTLPLRMSRAGLKGKAALTLFVIGEGRYSVQGFLEQPVDATKLTVDPTTEKSNYDAVVETQLAADDGRQFVVEYARDDANNIALTVSNTEGGCIPSPNAPSLGGGNDGADAGQDAGQDPGQDAGQDAGVDDASTDAATEASASPAPGSPLSITSCASQDLAVARTGMSGPLWITRLRASLPASAFSSDLRFQPSTLQQSVTNEYLVNRTSGGATVARVKPSGAGSAALFGATLAGLLVMLGRRRRSADRP